MRLSTLPACAALVLCATAPSPASAQSEEDAVLQVVVDLFDGMRARDEAALRGVFVDGARLSAPGTDDDGNPIVQNIPIDQFIASIVGATTEATLDERIYDPEVRIADGLATVWVGYDFYVGDDFSHCGFDAFQLTRTADGWKIFQIADTRRREGCPER